MQRPKLAPLFEQLEAHRAEYGKMQARGKGVL
jgi:hypothetical protein